MKNYASSLGNHQIIFLHLNYSKAKIESLINTAGKHIRSFKCQILPLSCLSNYNRDCNGYCDHIV